MRPYAVLVCNVKFVIISIKNESWERISRSGILVRVLRNLQLFIFNFRACLAGTRSWLHELTDGSDKALMSHFFKSNIVRF